MVSCPFCGASNRAGATFCQQCGGLQPGAKAPAASAAQASGRTTGAPLHATGMLPPQSSLRGHYLILRKVGQGGMAAVYQARDVTTNRIVAIKEMSQDGLSAEDVRDALASFRFEADTLLRLHHRNLPAVYERFSEGARHYLAMEFIEGETLEERQVAARKAGHAALPEAEVLAWADQLADVLGYLHAQRPPIIFRDLKPGNVMLSRDGTIKLIDFGIARVFSPARTKDTQVLGTPGFAPPEQYGKAQTDARADIYALACTLYQLLTGHDPSDTPFSLPPMHTKRANISPHIQLAVERATRLDRDQRYPTVDDFRRDLLHPTGLYFRSGRRAASLREVLDLCRAYPQEAGEHLYSGRIEGWLLTWGETSAARTARMTGTSTNDHAEGLRRFLAAVSTNNGTNVGGGTAKRPAASATAGASAWSAQRTGAATATAAAASTAAPPQTQALVEPRAVDFGSVVAGQRAIAHITVKGAGGGRVRGTIRSLGPWLTLDKTSFDGASTIVQLTADTRGLPTTGVTQTSIQITAGTTNLYLTASLRVTPAPVAVRTPAAASAAPAKSKRGKQTGNTAATPSAPRPVPQKYLAVQRAAPRGVGVVRGAIVGIIAAQAPLVLGPQVWSRVAGVAAPGWALLVFLTLAATLAAPGALLGAGGPSWRGRANTAVLGTAVGTGAALLLANSGGGAAPPLWALTTTTPLLWLLPLLAAVGAALGGEYVISRALLRTMDFVSRRFALVLLVSGIVGGAWLGATALGAISAGFLAPVGVLVGAIVGAWVARRTNRLMRRATAGARPGIRP